MSNPPWQEVVKKPNSLWILRWEMGFSASLGVLQLSRVVCEVVGRPGPGVVCSQEKRLELQISSECTRLFLLGRVGQSPFPASVGFLLWAEGEWASLTFSLLACQMPVAKRPRKSSSDLDQGSPSLTEEENSETSSESEKNSDQVRGFWDTLVWRLAGRWGKGWRKSIAI